jgi:hypothetical protein
MVMLITLFMCATVLLILVACHPLFAFCIHICHIHCSVNTCLQIDSRHPHHYIILYNTECPSTG